VHGGASGSGDKIQNTMKVLEEYAIESSIAKVYGSEMRFRGREACKSSAVTDSTRLSVCRAYRDSRINRIFKAPTKSTAFFIIKC